MMSKSDVEDDVHVLQIGIDELRSSTRMRADCKSRKRYDEYLKIAHVIYCPQQSNV